MQKIIATILAFCLCLPSLIHAENAKKLQRKALRYFEPLPAEMPGAEQDTPERITLGEKLFSDTRLSVNDSQSCASCHRLGPGLAGVDNLPTSPGAKGKLGNRNSPTVLNAGYQFTQFWDGRAPDLVEQAKGPILNPVEMGMPDALAVENKIKEIKEYQPLFAKAFPEDANPINYHNLASAIAAFERTLRTNDRFDDFLNGDLEALSELELKGLKTFMKHNCQLCHDGPLLGGSIFEKLGQRDAKYANQSDLGRFEVTKADEDKMVFKVPMLRNIALTAPYYHDGKLATLADAIYSMGELQASVKLSNQEVKEMEAFLGALTDKELAKANQP